MNSSDSKTILVVEDDPSTRAGLVDLLLGEGFSVVSAANGREALELLAAADEPPSLILLDLMMPVMDGWRFLAERRRTAGTAPRTPVVLLSGLGFIADAGEVADFLRKPVDAAALLRCVQRFCGAPVRETMDPPSA